MFVSKAVTSFRAHFSLCSLYLGIKRRWVYGYPSLNSTACTDPRIEDKEITRDRGLPNLDFMMEGMATTMDDCFPDMDKVMYGSRIIAKLVDDVPCEDPEYNQMCKEEMEKNRVIEEDNCLTPKYVI